MSDQKRAELDDNSPERRRPIFSLVLVTILIAAAITGFVVLAMQLIEQFGALGRIHDPATQVYP